MSTKVNISTDIGSDAERISAALSHRLKSFRQQQKLSLDELSRRAGVSKGMLVEIEKCAANPSIAILCKLAAVLGISVADIVEVAPAPTVRVVGAAEIPTLWQGEKGGSARLLVGSSGPTMIELWRWEMQPGERFASSGHPQGTFELFHVEQGTLTLEIAEAPLEVGEGASAVARTDVPHAYANQTDRLLIFTMTVAEFH